MHPNNRNFKFFNKYDGNYGSFTSIDILLYWILNDETDRFRGVTLCFGNWKAQVLRYLLQNLTEIV